MAGYAYLMHDTLFDSVCRKKMKNLRWFVLDGLEGEDHRRDWLELKMTWRNGTVSVITIITFALQTSNSTHGTVGTKPCITKHALQVDSYMMMILVITHIFMLWSYLCRDALWYQNLNSSGETQLHILRWLVMGQIRNHLKPHRFLSHQKWV